MNQDYLTVRKIIQQRQTFKVMTDAGSPVQYSDQVDADHRATIRDAIAQSDWAPFHYDRDQEGVPQPWRFHVLWSPACRTMAKEFHDWFTDVKPNNKLPAMLSACGALVLVNWIPQFSFANRDQKHASGNQDKQIQVDEEHLAATSAAVQNLLLLLTAAGMGTYWSSGGQLRTAQAFERLGIPADQRLLAAVFVDYPESNMDSGQMAKTDSGSAPIPNAVQRLAGKQRDRRAEPARWLREIESL